MPVCKFSHEYPTFDITPVDNLFIEEYLPHAPGEYIKVYLYGLRLCYSGADLSLARMANILGLDEETVLGAFSYWERQKLVRRLTDNPPVYEYINVRATVMAGGGVQKSDAMYTMGQFNAVVKRLLDGRDLHGTDYARMYDWMHDYSLSEEALLSVIEYFASENKAQGKRVPTLTAIEKEVKKMAQANVVTDSAVKEYLHALSSDSKNTRRILRHLGINRNPSVDEEALYTKWKNWGYDMDTLLALCAETTAARNPTLAYLDKIVEGYRQRGLFTKDEIDTFRETEKADFTAVLKALNPALSYKEAWQQEYHGWRNAGVAHEVILEAAKDRARRTYGTFEKLSELVLRWKEAGILTVDDLSRERIYWQTMRQSAKQLLLAAGSEKPVRENDIHALRAWRDAGWSEEMLLCAAESAKGSEYPFSYMGRLLASWKEAGFTTPAQVAQSKQKAASAVPAEPKRAGKTVAAQQYEGQRKYTAQEYDSLFMDLNTLGDENE